MARDPIVDEVRAIREELAARFGFNVRAIAEDARKRQKSSGHKVVSLPPKRPGKTSSRVASRSRPCSPDASGERVRAVP